MKCTIIFEPNIYGHRLEYLHSLYEFASTIHDEHFVFILPNNFNDEKDKFEWPTVSNIDIAFINNRKSTIGGNRRLGFAYNTIKLALSLRSYVKKYKATDVFLINLMALYPAVTYILPKCVNISGIIYYIFLYDKLSEKQKRKNWRKYKKLAETKNIKSVFLLNDSKSAEIFNQKYCTEKFRRLADPISVMNTQLEDIRKTYNISDDVIIFSHFGGLTTRKGTLKILEAISFLEDKRKYAFIFAGKAYDDISSIMHDKVESLKSQGYQIFYEEGFVSYEFLSSLAAGSSCILVPYSNTCQSSGALAYSAFYKTNVIGPSEGFLGELIKKYHLGTTIDKITPECIAEAVANFTPSPIDDTYCRDNSRESFCRTILE